MHGFLLGFFFLNGISLDSPSRGKSNRFWERAEQGLAQGHIASFLLLGTPYKPEPASEPRPPALKTQFSLSKKALSRFRRSEAGTWPLCASYLGEMLMTVSTLTTKGSDEVFVKILRRGGRFSFLKCKQPLLRGDSTGGSEKDREKVRTRCSGGGGGWGGTRTVDQPQPSSGTQRPEWKLHAVRQGAERPQRAGQGGAGPSLHLLLAQSLGLGRLNWAPAGQGSMTRGAKNGLAPGFKGQR